MTTTLNNLRRIFCIHIDKCDGDPDIFCNLEQIPEVYAAYPDKVVKIRHYWNGKFTRISRKDLKAMFEAAKIQFRA